MELENNTNNRNTKETKKTKLREVKEEGKADENSLEKRSHCGLVWGGDVSGRIFVAVCVNRVAVAHSRVAVSCFVASQSSAY